MKRKKAKAKIKEKVKGQKAAKLKGLEEEKERRSVGIDWPEFRNKSDSEVLMKLKSLSSDRMLTIYKELEKEMAFRIDPQNYRRPQVFENFLILWRAKKERERKPEVKDTTYEPVTDELREKIFKG